MMDKEKIEKAKKEIIPFKDGENTVNSFNVKQQLQRMGFDKGVEWALKKVKNNDDLDHFINESKLLKAFVDFYNYRNTGDKQINYDEIEIFIDSL